MCLACKMIFCHKKSDKSFSHHCMIVHVMAKCDSYLSLSGLRSNISLLLDPVFPRIHFSQGRLYCQVIFKYGIRY